MCIVDLQTKVGLSSYKDMKNVIVQVFKIKPFEFSGVCRNQSNGTVSFLISTKAFELFLKNKPHPEAGTIVPWNVQQMLSNRHIAHNICAQVLSLPSRNSNFKKEAQSLQNWLMGSSTDDYLDFLWGVCTPILQ